MGLIPAEQRMGKKFETRFGKQITGIIKIIKIDNKIYSPFL
jgi:hypothetical protein